MSCSGTAPPPWSAATWSPCPGPPQTGLCPCPWWPRELLGQTFSSPGCEDSVPAAAPDPLGPPMLYPPCHLVCCLGAPTGTSVSSVLALCLFPAGPGIGPGLSSVRGGIYRAGLAVRSVLHRQRRGITQVFTHLCIFWVTFYFTMRRGGKGPGYVFEHFLRTAENLYNVSSESREINLKLNS